MTNSETRKTQPKPSADGAFLRYGMLTAAVVLDMLVIAAWVHSDATATIAIAASIMCAALAITEQRRPRLGPKPVAIAVSLVMLVAVVAPPRISKDLWSYTMQGRIVAVHHEDPYAHVPSEFPTDPFELRVSTTWRHTGSVYGPVFVGVAVAGATIAGDSVLAARLFFQLCAAIAVSLILMLVWRRTRSPAALIWIGLHPLVVATVVNGGHNDALVALAIVLAVAVARRDRFVLAGVILGLAAMVKVTAILALIGLVAWAWRQRRRRAAVRSTIAATVTLLLGYLPVLTRASSVLRGADHQVTAASLWNGIATLFVDRNAGRDLNAATSTIDTIYTLGMITVLALVLWSAWRASRSRAPEPPVAAPLAAFSIANAYTYPWYGIWGLPLLAARRPSTLAWVVWTQAAVMVAAHRLPTHNSGHVFDTLLRVPLTFLAPPVLLVVFILAVRSIDAGPAPV